MDTATLHLETAPACVHLRGMAPEQPLLALKVIGDPPKVWRCFVYGFCTVEVNLGGQLACCRGCPSYDPWKHPSRMLDVSIPDSVPGTKGESS